MAGLLVFTAKDDVRNWVRQQKHGGKRVALVPTMVRIYRPWETPGHPWHASSCLPTSANWCICGRPLPPPFK